MCVCVWTVSHCHILFKIYLTWIFFVTHLLFNDRTSSNGWLLAVCPCCSSALNRKCSFIQEFIAGVFRMTLYGFYCVYQIVTTNFNMHQVIYFKIPTEYWFRELCADQETIQNSVKTMQLYRKTRTNTQTHTQRENEHNEGNNRSHSVKCWENRTISFVVFRARERK